MPGKKKIDERIANLDRVKNATAGGAHNKFGHDRKTLAARLRIVRIKGDAISGLGRQGRKAEPGEKGGDELKG